MKSPGLWLGFLLAVALWGCRGVETVHVDAPVASMTFAEARKALREAFTRSKIAGSGTATGISINRRQAAIHIRVPPTKRIITFAEVGEVKVEGYSADLWQVRWSQTSKVSVDGPAINVLSFQTKELAVHFAESLLVAKLASAALGTGEADFAAFRARLGDPRPEMPDAARADKALAEDAFKRKDFQAALDSYGDALEKHPLWPEGQYNAALLAAEVEDYELAAHHMRRYLALAPDAKDAAAAKEKFLLWQLKSKN